jgi:hypothetical protein
MQDNRVGPGKVDPSSVGPGKVDPSSVAAEAAMVAGDAGRAGNRTRVTSWSR